MISDPKGLMQLQFVCPKCGSRRFGTSNCTDWDKAIGHCRGCRYTWSRKDEDHLVFHKKENLK